MVQGACITGRPLIWGRYATESPFSCQTLLARLLRGPWSDGGHETLPRSWTAGQGAPLPPTLAVSLGPPPGSWRSPMGFRMWVSGCRPPPPPL